MEAAKSTDIPPIGFALIRPPGNDWESSLFNTVSIAARYVQRVHRLKRVLIIDFDVCYGSQTSSTFYDDPDVLYLSTHEVSNNLTKFHSFIYFYNQTFYIYMNIFYSIEITH